MPRTLLVVDENPMARESLIKAVATLRRDWRVVEAQDPKQALSAARRERPGVVVIDFNVQGRDGLGLAEELRALDTQIPLAVISANFHEDLASRGRRVRAGHLPKPLRPHVLGEFIRQAEVAIGHRTW